MNCFRLSNGKLDRKFLRTCAVFKLLRQGRITSYDRALELLRERHGNDRSIENTLQIWWRDHKQRGA